MSTYLAIAKKYALPGFFIFLGTIPLVGALIVYRNTNLYLAEAAKAEGTVVKVVRPPNNDVYYPVVQFTSQNGQTIEFQSSVGSRPPSYSKSQKVEVLYRPTNPQDAQIRNFFSLWWGSITLAGSGGLLFLTGTLTLLAIVLNKGRVVEGQDEGAEVLTRRSAVFTGRRRTYRSYPVVIFFWGKAINPKYAFALIFNLIGIGTLVLTWSIQNIDNAFLASAARAEGTVVELVERRSISKRQTSQSIYTPVVQFTSQNGQTIEFVGSSSYPPRYSEGQKVEVLYQPTNPQDARISGEDSSDSTLSIFTGIGGVFILMGTGVFLPGLLKRRKDKYLKQHGMPIETEYQSVQTDTWLTVTGRHRSRVVTQWQNPSTGELHIFKSDHLWSDPSSYIENEKITKITVFIEEGNPKKYYVDLSFLPNPDLSPDD